MGYLVPLVVEPAQRFRYVAPDPFEVSGGIMEDGDDAVLSGDFAAVGQREAPPGPEVSLDVPHTSYCRRRVLLIIPAASSVSSGTVESELKVEFSTQLGVEYGFRGGDLPRDGGDPLLELAYAITVHKSQGSEFGTTLLVVPNPCRILSRELLYTALTRQTDRVVVLHQGPLSDLLSFSYVDHSETARRYTNLFRDPQPLDIGGGRLLEANLIHRTWNGTLVRSKSELIVADALSAAGIEFAYEKEFRGYDGSPRFPDFTIEDAATGDTYLWEHLGMLANPQYARAWERKRAWYRASGVEEGGGEVATLIVTKDDEHGGIDSAEVQAGVQEIA